MRDATPPVPAVEERLEVELEDHGHSSALRSIVTTLTGQSGIQSYRFVGRPVDGSSGEVTVSDTFPVLPLSLVPGHVAPDEGWPEEVAAALEQLDADLRRQGWRRVGLGEHWWSRIYARPSAEPKVTSAASGAAEG